MNDLPIEQEFETRASVARRYSGAITGYYVDVDTWREIRARIYAIEQRYSLARESLIATGYFKPEEVGPDIAPRITELWSSCQPEEINMNHLITPPTPEFDRVMEDVRKARHHQIEKGYTPEHDDREHKYIQSLMDVATRKMAGSPHVQQYERQDLVDGIAVLVAAVEGFDRREAEDKN